MAHSIRILTESDLRATLKLDLAVIDCVEQAFVALASGQVVMPPVLSMALEAQNAEVDVKTAYIPGFEGFAIKVSPGFFNNPALGLPSLNGLMVLLSAKTGLVEAVLLDNGYLTDLRTAAAGAVAARHLAPESVQTACVFGTGVQARLQMQAAYRVRPFERLLVWGRDRTKAEQCAADLAESLGVQTEVREQPRHMLAEAQLAVTTTPSKTPLIQADWLHSGLHITAMGSDQGEKNEIDPRALSALSAYVCDRVSQCRVLGELRSALDAGLWPSSQIPAELGQVIGNPALGRQSPSDITLCDLTGTGAQDTAIATLALAVAGDVGQRITV